MAKPTRKSMACFARDNASAQALAPSLVQQRKAVLLPGRGCRDGNMAYRSRTPRWSCARGLAGASERGQRGCQSRAAAPGVEVSDGCRQDHGDGYADRMANRECRAPTNEQTI